MAAMLRHKETGELFIYTALLATNPILEPVIEDPVKKVIDEVKAEEAAAEVVGETTPAIDAIVDEVLTGKPVVMTKKQKAAVKDMSIEAILAGE